MFHKKGTLPFSKVSDWRKSKRKCPFFQAVYDRLYAVYGPQHWWPGETPFEVMVGAILTQNTNWQNVEKAIANIRKGGHLSFRALHDLPMEQLAALIRPAGYFNIKAGRIKNFLHFMVEHYGGSVARMAKRPLEELRPELLSVNGIGPETADSILLYALNKPVFVVDAYTRRLLVRHGFPEEAESYESMQALFMSNLPRKVGLYNEYHALIVRLGKDFRGDVSGRSDYPLGASRFFPKKLDSPCAIL